ncbi:MAG: sodium/proton-translocating pyrophosphatase, partial [Synergistaceae bacterium]|nr:sodium/proton-translocating pyrophosphatase [Synergistaceae bacterium]
MWLFLVFVTLVFGALAGLYAWTVYQKLDEFKIGHPSVAELSSIIHEGAMAFLKKEYSWLAPFVGVVAVLLIAAPGLGLGSAFAFVLGALCSATAGWIGMYVATNSNGRTTYAALAGMPAEEKTAAKSAKKSVELDKAESAEAPAPVAEAPKSDGILSAAAGTALEVAF